MANPLRGEVNAEIIFPGHVLRLTTDGQAKLETFLNGKPMFAEMERRLVNGQVSAVADFCAFALYRPDGKPAGRVTLPDVPTRDMAKLCLDAQVQPFHDITFCCIR
ncbi:MAG: hypothetical protein AAGE59_09205 [Cyanobacteria bacterium P01_F01_bin.86]